MNFDAIDFGQAIPLFPLPNCVLFPGVVQPLHIFEPRYQEMIADVIEGQGALGMVLLKEGWEKEYYGSPAVFELGCVGKVVAHERLEDGKYNLLLHGVVRARVLSEKKQGLYRVGRMEEVRERDVTAGATMEVQRKVLRELFEKTALKDLTVAQSLAALFEESVPTARLMDVLAFTLVQDVPTKQRLLEELDPVKRGEHLLRELVGLAQVVEGRKKEEGTSWPPSVNAN